MTETTEPSTELAQSDLLTADDILQADDTLVKVVDVPEWSKNGKAGKVRVKGMSGTERDAYVTTLRVLDPRTKQYVPNNTNATAKLVAHCIVDGKGELLFTNAHVAALGRKNAAALMRVHAVAAKLSGLDDDDAEDAEKNSEQTETAESPSDGSTSSQPEPPASQ